MIEKQIQRYAQRPGFRLADVAEVGLPVYKLNLVAVTLAHKRIAPIEEFLLRCLGMQLSTPKEMSGFLGISEEVINPALANLVDTENIALSPAMGRQSWTLTTKGKATVSTAEIISPEERTFPIHFDAILRKPVIFRPHQLLDYKELQERGLIEIEVYPPKRPGLTEISAADLERLLRAVPASAEKRRDILAVRTLDQRSIRKQYIRAVALVFRGLDASETQLGFVVDGKLSREHENAFSQCQGLSRTIESIGERDPEEQKEIQAAAEALVLPEAVIVARDKIQSSAREAEAEVAGLSEDLEIAGDAEKQALKKRLDEAEASLAALKSQERQYAIQYLYVTDHAPLLDDTMLNAQRRVMIISPWIKAAVVDQNFLTRLEHLLRKGVYVYIGYGISEDETQKLKAWDTEARKSIRVLASTYQNLCFLRLGDTHAKVLIKDDEYAVVTSFNWLSFKGDPSRKFRDEQGVLLRSPALVDEKFNAQLARFRSNISKSESR